MKVLLLQPNYRKARESGVWQFNPPIGLGYIAAVLEQNNIPVEILDANVLNLTPEQAVIKSRDFDIVGIGMLTPGHNFSVSVAELLPTNILKIAGGPHATGYCEELLKKGFDAVIRGEGEYSFLDIAQGKDFKDVDGISYKKDGTIKHNPSRAPVHPDKIPFPARHLMISKGVNLPYQSTGTVLFPWSPIITSRGCPYNCYYCNKNISGTKFRARSPENVIEEIIQLKKYGVKEIDIYDDCFNFDLERAEKILDLIIEKKIKLHIRCSNGLRVDKVNSRFLNKLKKAGCKYIGYGVESGSQEVLDKIPKGVTLDQIRNAVKLTKKAGINVTGFFVLGLIGDTIQTMQQTIDFAKELNPDVFSIGIATPYPGTRMYDLVKKNGKLLIENWEDFHHTEGKMFYTYPGTATPKQVAYMFKKANKEYYFRPKYIINQILKINSVAKLKFMLRGAKTLLKITK